VATEVPRDQHIVSQSLLRAWTINRKLLAFNKVVGRSRLRSTKSEGYVRDFITEQASEAEHTWKQIEDFIPVIHEGLEHDGTELSEEVLNRVSDAMALHYARSLQQKKNFDQITRRTSDNASQLAGADLVTVERYLNDHELFLLPGSPASISRAETFIRTFVKVGLPTSTIFSEGVLAHLTVAQDELAGRQVVVVAAPQQTQFCIGDTPAQVLNPATRQRGGPLRPDSLLVLPLSPRHLAVAGWEDAVQLDETAVDILNQAQYAGSKTKIYVLPGAPIIGRIEQWNAASGTPDE